MFRFPAVRYVTSPVMNTFRFPAVLGVYSFAGGNADLGFIGKHFPQLNYNYMFHINVERIQLVKFIVIKYNE